MIRTSILVGSLLVASLTACAPVSTDGRATDTATARPSATSVIDNFLRDDLRAYGDPAGYLPEVREWSRSDIEKIGLNFASATYRGPAEPSAVSPIDVIVTMYPTKDRAQAAFLELVGKYPPAINLGIDVPAIRAGPLPIDVHSSWLGFAFHHTNAVIDVRLGSNTVIPPRVNAAGTRNPRFWQLYDYLQSFATAHGSLWRRL